MSNLFGSDFWFNRAPNQIQGIGPMLRPIPLQGAASPQTVPVSSQPLAPQPMQAPQFPQAQQPRTIPMGPKAACPVCRNFGG